MERFEDRGLVLGTVDYGDADRIVTLLTHRHGKMSAFAAGARKSKRRFAGALEPMTLLTMRLVERQGTTWRLDSVDIERSFHSIREDLPRIARGLYAVELCREVVREAEPHPDLFELLADYLEILDRKAAGPTSLLAFELSALALAGLMPRFDRCAICGAPIASSARFDAEHGGTVCAGCIGRVGPGVEISKELAQGLSSLQKGVHQPLPAAVRREAREVLNLFIRHHLGRKLRSVEFMHQVGTD